ncbi:MAG: hypothetical protein LBK42_10265 [Propionibacteriaceae bacterium]|jgi:hypothetical protein|nr:hypothetical protein [Propionibacteriaceae bacterium]
MDWWALAVTGLAATAALLGAAWSDQRRRRRRQAVLRAVPERPIPGLERDLKPKYVLPDDHTTADPATDHPTTPEPEPQHPPANNHNQADPATDHPTTPEPEPQRPPANDHNRADPAVDRPATPESEPQGSPAASHEPEPQRPTAADHDWADGDGAGEPASPTPEPPGDQAAARTAADHDRAEPRTRVDPASAQIYRFSTTEPHRSSVDLGSALAGGWADDRFVTDRARGWAVLDHPLVLVAEQITAFRQLWPALARCRRAETGLVVVAADFDPATVATLAVNVVWGRLAAVAVRCPDPAAREAVARATGAKPMRLADLLSGYLPADGLGTCATWVSDAGHSWALPAAASGRETPGQSPGRHRRQPVLQTSDREPPGQTSNR